MYDSSARDPGDTAIFVHIKCDNVAERNFPVIIEFYQFTIHAYW